MASGAKQPSTIFKIRTFAEDVKRATAGASATPQTPTATSPIAQSLESAIANEINRTPNAMPSMPLDIDRPTQTTAAAAEIAAFDIRSEASINTPDATIVQEHRAQRWSFDDALQTSVSTWIKELKRMFDTPKEPTIITADVAPRATIENPEPPRVERISEPRLLTPLPHATAEEAGAYRESLRAALPVREVPLPQTQAFKQAPPVRVRTESDESARARLAALSATIVQPQAEVKTERKNVRDIPFIPPTFTHAQEATPLRTYRNDALDDVREHDLSATKIAAAELTRRYTERAPIIITRPPSRAIPILTIVSIVLIFGASATYLFERYRSASPVVPTVTARGFFSTETDHTLTLPTDRAVLLGALRDLRDTEIPQDSSFIEFEITNESGERVSAQSVLAVLDPRAPGTFVRAIDNPIMFGTYGADGTPFIILKIASYEAGFAGMLAWEQTMSADLAPFFGEPVRKSYEAGSLTVDETRPAVFKDRVVQNIDTRLLVDEIGDERIIYAFADEETIVIARNAGALTAILEKLR